MAKKSITYAEVLSNLKKKKYDPVYYLMGDESYYTDLISNYIIDNVLTESEKEFNETVMYGPDVDIVTIINAAKRYPMMSEHQVIVVKEAQSLKNLDKLVYYLENPLKSTILVFCHMHGSIDKRKKVAAAVDKVGVLFESKKLKDYQLPNFISNYFKQKSLTIDSKAINMLAEFVGNDLSRLSSEMDKLCITLPKQITRVVPDHIEKNIGISKDFNNFELRNAIIDKDVYKANLIIDYFEQNPKTNPIQVTLSLLFSFFSNLMLAYYSPQKSEEGVCSFLGLKSTWQVKDYMLAMKKYSGVKTMNIISLIREADARSKGVNNSSATSGEILKELIFKILH